MEGIEGRGRDREKATICQEGRGDRNWGLKDVKDATNTV